MPIYEYLCEACGEKNKVFHRSRKEPTPSCEACGESALKRLVSRTNFQLKGGGWYVTDYAKSSKEDGSKEASSESGTEGSDTSSQTSSDSGGSESSGSDTESTSDSGSSGDSGDSGSAVA